MSELAEDLCSLDSQTNIQEASAQARSEFLNSWAQHLHADAGSLPVDASTRIHRIFLTHDTIVDYKPVEATKRSFALGAHYLTAGNHRTFTERVEDFTHAAARRLADPERQKAYIDGQINKIIGIGEGLNDAKEDVKATAAAALKAAADGTTVNDVSSTAASGWKVLTDGTVTEFLSRPSAINDPIVHTVANALNTIPKDPQAVGKALDTLGNSIVEANNRFNALTPEQQGKLLGKMMFAGLIPESEAAEGELVQKGISEQVTHTDMHNLRQSLEIAQQELIKKSVDEKLCKFILNREHGKQRYKWFESALGFTLENKQGLANQILLEPGALQLKRLDDFGIMYEQYATIAGTNGKILKHCKIYWQQDEQTGLFEFKNLLLPKK